VLTPDGEIHSLALEGTVEDAKWTLSEKLGLPVFKLDLIAAGRSLNNGESSLFVEDSR